MSSGGYPAIPEFRGVLEDGLFLQQPRLRHRYWLHALLFLLTLLTTTLVGWGLEQSFAGNQPYDLEAGLFGYAVLWHNPAAILSGLPFSLTLLAILLAHEFGHYCTARYYRVNASLPYFLPAPTLIGTLGAFIRIRTPILSKRALFDIGIAGPLAGFVLLIGPLAAGVSLSKVVPGVESRGDLIFGTPLLMRFFEWVQFPGVPTGDILLHPVARAAWVGLLATALNLLPIGQLDGGHILYAFAGERTKWLSRIFVGVLAVLGVFQIVTTHYHNGYNWIFWALLLTIFALRHPRIADPRRMGAGRGWLAVVALAMLLLSFTSSPVRSAGL